MPEPSVYGWSLPLTLDADAAFPRRRVAPIEDAIRLIVEVARGERPLRPDFGCRIHDLASIETREERQIASALIEEALETWAPELRIRRVDIADVRRTPADAMVSSGASRATITLDVWREQSRFAVDVLWFGAVKPELEEGTR